MMYFLAATNIILAAAVLFTGLRALKYAEQASAVSPYPEWPLDPTGQVPFEPIDERIAQLGQNVAVSKAFEAAGKINQRAACWTWFTIILGFAIAFINAVAPFVLQ